MGTCDSPAKVLVSLSFELVSKHGCFLSAAWGC